jgi:hypothetical protein
VAFLVFLEWPETVAFLEVLEHRARQGMQAFLAQLERLVLRERLEFPVQQVKFFQIDSFLFKCSIT